MDKTHFILKTLSAKNLSISPEQFAAFTSGEKIDYLLALKVNLKQQEFNDTFVSETIQSIHAIAAIQKEKWQTELVSQGTLNCKKN